MRQLLAEAMNAIVSLEQKAADAMAPEEVRVYEWRPSSLPELPAIWNWIDDGSYEIVDTHRADDLIVVSTTIGVKPSDLSETMGKLLKLTDTFRSVIDPALAQNHTLNNTVREARRMVTRTEMDEFGQTPVMCMTMLIRLDLVGSIR